MGSDCFIMIEIHDGPAKVPQGADLHDAEAWQWANENRDLEHDPVETKMYQAEEDAEAMRRAGFSGKVLIDPSDGDGYEVWFTPRRMLFVSSMRSESMPTVLKACWEHEICDSCRHASRCALRAAPPDVLWAPRADGHGSAPVTYLVPKGHALKLVGFEHMRRPDASS